MMETKKCKGCKEDFDEGQLKQVRNAATQKFDDLCAKCEPIFTAFNCRCNKRRRDIKKK